MSEAPPTAGALAVFTLSETRRFIRQSHARMMVVFFAIVYALGSMVLGGMLILARTPGSYTAEVIWGNALGTGAWNYPGFLLLAPWGVVDLPFLATWSMVVVSIGVGIGVSVALLITARLIRDRRRAAAQPGSAGAIAGLTPAMIALVTLGACCSTTAAATAGVGLVAQASGSTLNNLLINNWYLDVFQIVVIAVALLAQEMILEIYGGLFGLRGSASGGTAVGTPRLDRRTLVAGAFRAVLLVAGVTWSLAMFAEWTTVAPQSASASVWFQWAFQHQLLAGLAIAVAMFPSATTRFLSKAETFSASGLARAALLVAGLSLAVGVPPAVAAAGAPGFVNELLGTLGVPSAWGGATPVFAPGLTLYLRWTFQYLLLGGFAVGAAIFPSRILGPLRTASGSVLEEEPVRATVSLPRGDAAATVSGLR